MAKDFRFGMSMRFYKSREALLDKAKRAEDAGFDILCVPDHLGAAAPFPTLTAVAMVTTTLRLSMYVLNSAFYKPALLSRDMQALDLLSDGRPRSGWAPGMSAKSSKPPRSRIPAPASGSTTSNT